MGKLHMCRLIQPISPWSRVDPSISAWSQLPTVQEHHPCTSNNKKYFTARVFFQKDKLCQVGEDQALPKAWGTTPDLCQTHNSMGVRDSMALAPRAECENMGGRGHIVQPLPLLPFYQCPKLHENSYRLLPPRQVTLEVLGYNTDLKETCHQDWNLPH